MSTKKWQSTPDRLNEDDFRKMIREWAKKVDAHGEEILRHKKIIDTTIISYLLWECNIED